MATWDDVRAAALALPGTTESTSRGWRTWTVRGRLFVWERPLGSKDVAELGDAAPDGAVLAARVPDEGAKRALVADEPTVYFTTSHFDGHPAVLARLGALSREALDELVVEAWAQRAAPTVVRAHLGEDPS